MSELETEALQIGNWVVSAVISLWIDDRAMPADWYTPETVSIHAFDRLVAGVPSVIRQRRLAREFEQIADTVSDWLLNEASSQAGLPDEVLRNQVFDASRALVVVTRTHAKHLRKWRDPILLASLICGEAGLPVIGGIIVLASCVALREALAHMRGDGENEIPENVAEIPERVHTALRGISTDVINQFQAAQDTLYHRLVIDSMGLSRELTSLFVQPRLRYATRGDAESPVDFDEALTTSRHLIVQGAPGSGKTTTLLWLAARAAQSKLSEQASDERLPQPFFVPLRNWTQANRSAVMRLEDLVAAPLDASLPPAFVRRHLEDDTPLLLIDGLDELPRPDRAEAWEWLRTLVTEYPAAGIVVTTRPPAVRELPPIAGFEIADLLPMNNTQIAQYVHNWYSVAADEWNEADLTRYERALLNAIANSPHIARLASSPLMCALLCTLTIQRRAILPRRQDIYAASLELLLGPNDSEPRAVGATHLSQIQSTVLLEQIAYWFLSNDYAEADRNDVVHQIDLELRNMPEIKDPPDHVLRSLVANPGVLRESVPGRIDFVHQAMAEYLMARAVVDQGAVGSLVPRAHEQPWREVAVLAAGQASTPDCIRLLNGLLRRANTEPQHWSDLLDTARACLRDRPDLHDSPVGQALASMTRHGPDEGPARSRIIVAVDIAYFAAPHRTHFHQLSMRDGLFKVLQRAFDQTEVPWELSWMEDRGDGALVVAPPGIPIRTFARELPDQVATGLREFNATRSGEAEMRLRMAIHSGVVSITRDGVAGQALSTAVRLLDAHAVKDALRGSPGVLALILSDRTYQEVNDASGRYRPCTVTAKDAQINAWVGVFGADRDRGVPGSSAANPPTTVDPQNVLKRAWARLARREAETPLAVVRARAEKAMPARDGLAALRRPEVRVLSALPADTGRADPVWLARQFEAAGVGAISLATDQLSRNLLAEVRAAVDVPLLCDDVVISPYQVYEARSWGADMMLLNAVLLNPRTLAELCGLVEQLGMTGVVRVGDSAEADRALEAGARVVTIDTQPGGPTEFGLVAGDLPVDVFKIAEGIRDVSDVEEFGRAGADAVLIDSVHDGSDLPAAIRQMVVMGEHRWSTKS